ncbi:hypothetical protein Q31b_49770 [Novipirellula aureliae]|uniref:Uncharacterized protein n=1 Tax=Novipirellula aureliae TaxID=2527966 RepID=A0A5C6DKF5_9BACT|nr:hypothetical protein [Novipirellula aureliae]TWU36695.1 hypothetical protein Q31b_49770 [Novipirellula aureliae]
MICICLQSLERNSQRHWGVGVLIEGDKGRIFVSRGTLTGAPVEELEDNPLPEDAIQKVYKGHPLIANERKAHWANFLLCVRNRQEPISDVHSHMRALNICHLAGITARLGREINGIKQPSRSRVTSSRIRQRLRDRRVTIGLAFSPFIT